MSNSQKPVIVCKGVSKTFIDGKQQLQVLKEIDISIEPGSQIAIMGRSGSGKTTLLQLLGGLDVPTTGNVVIQGHNLCELSPQMSDKLRNQSIGFIYQLHHLLPEFTALENVMMPLLIADANLKAAKQQALEMLAIVGLSDRVTHYPGKLSGGERQRVAVARALITHPACVLADEPTGSLDTDSATVAFALMQKLNRERGTTFIVVTHDRELAARMDKTYDLKDGKLSRLW